MSMLFKRLAVLVSLSLFFVNACYTQKPNTDTLQKFNSDTISVTLQQAEKMFLDKNLELLAQKYNVDATKALIIQAKLWPNPSFNFNQVLYNPQSKQWFPVDRTNGEESVQLSQLIVLAGKIKKQVQMAKTNYRLAEDNLYDLLRTLKYGLHSTYYNIYYMEQTARVYDEEIDALKVIVAAFKQQEGKGYIPMTEVVSVQAQLYALQNEYQALTDNINDQQSQLRLFLETGPKAYIVPVVDSLAIDQADPMSITLQTMLDSAKHNRTDLMIAKENLTLSQQNYSYQKAMGVPDITLSGGWDEHGSYIVDYNYLGLGFNLPIFNWNQGNIKNSKILIDFNKTNLDFTEETVTEQVTRGLQKAIDADKLYRGIDKTFAPTFDRLAKAVMENYLKRNMGLLDFLNFYDLYHTNIVQLNTIRYNRINALENLNFLTGTNFFKY